MASLDDVEELPGNVEAAWAEEIGRRLAEIDAGTVTTIPWPEAWRRIRAAASGRRATDRADSDEREP